MNKKQLIEMHADIPERVQSLIEMNEANTPIQIYKGDYELRIAESIIPTNGIIDYHWLPNLGVQFKGNPTIDISELIKLNTTVRLKY